MNSENKTPNRLINESSPYLLQHAFNPVDWYAWGEEAFNRAKEEDKPIFLSIGYSTCHWCHVMERESFEDYDVASLMNESFVSIKVDREERPDIDHIYMTVCQMMTGSGGWPLTIIMTADKKPFFAGTYFPKESHYGRIGILDLIEKVNDVWNNQRKEANSSAEKITLYLNEYNSSEKPGEINNDSIKNNFESLKRLFDTKNGGFGTAPKFPSSHNLMFLLRYYYHNEDEYALQMVEETIQSMYMGGIFDHIGFGFHRYSTDQKWLLPHFEKMLYDQATISYVLVELYAITKNDLYKNIAQKVFEYVERDLLSPEGYFYSAQDADSEGIEGKFYTWETEELKAVLTVEEYELFSKRYNIHESGNFEHESSRQKDGTNIPHLIDLIGADCAPILQKLFEVREKRVRPLSDKKMLTDWNSLMIASFAYAARVFNNKHYLDIAENAADFIASKMLKPDYSLYHVFLGEVKNNRGKLDDYSFFVFALLELYSTTFKTKYLYETINITEYILEHFGNGNGVFFLTSDNDEELISRPKQIYDSAIPSGGSVLAFNLIRLSRLTGNQDYMEIAVKYFKAIPANIENNSTAFSFLLTAYQSSLYKSKELLIADAENLDGFELSVKLSEKYSPNLTTILINNTTKPLLDKIIPFTGNYSIGNKTKYYLCENFICGLPESNLEEILSKM